MVTNFLMAAVIVAVSVVGFGVIKEIVDAPEIEE